MLRSQLDENSYPSEQPVTEMITLSLKGDNFHGDYRFSPK